MTTGPPTEVLYDLGTRLSLAVTCFPIPFTNTTAVQTTIRPYSCGVGLEI